MFVIICKYSAISYKGLEHPQILVSRWSPGTSPLQILKVDDIYDGIVFSHKKSNDVLINATVEITLKTLC